MAQLGIHVSLLRGLRIPSEATWHEGDLENYSGCRVDGTIPFYMVV